MKKIDIINAIVTFLSTAFLLIGVSNILIGLLEVTYKEVPLFTYEEKTFYFNVGIIILGIGLLLGYLNIISYLKQKERKEREEVYNQLFHSQKD